MSHQSLQAETAEQVRAQSVERARRRNTEDAWSLAAASMNSSEIERLREENRRLRAALDVAQVLPPAPPEPSTRSRL